MDMAKRAGTVLAFGTFDLLHPGHISYLKQAKKLAKKLIVIIARDLNVEKIKGRLPVNSENARRDAVMALGIADEAILGFHDDMIKSVEKVRPDIIALGYDQNPTNSELSKKLSARGINARIVRMKPHKPEIYKSSKLRKKIED